MSTSHPDRYAVVGHPIAHSKSPAIHAAFAQATGQAIVYERILAPIDGFQAAVDLFRKEGGRGLNVTLPFKLEAFQLATERTPRATDAGAVNTLSFDGESIAGDNTDGIGLVRDLMRLLGPGAAPLKGLAALVLGAGGAVRGILGPLLEAGVSVTIANRNVERAEELANQWPGVATAALSDLDPEGRFDLVLNATSASLEGVAVPVPAPLLARAAWIYDLAYGAGPGDRSTPFLAGALCAGAKRTSDGLGMLVEQAAESFWIWRGVRPATAPVLAALRAAGT